MKVITILCICILVLLTVIIVRALSFRPQGEPVPAQDTIDLDEDRIVQSLQQMIRCKTVSYDDASLVDRKEFEKFQELLAERYPEVHDTCQRTFHGVNGLLYHWKGKNDENPVVLMAHYDVVPAEESEWEKPAFEGILENGVIWGRGTLDTKGTVCGIFEAAEKLISEGFIPEKDIYFAFSGQEEIDGGSCAAIVDWFEKQGIQPSMVVDEGGAVVEDIFPGVNRECAVIGIAEKGIMNVELSMKSNGGHASAPPKHTIVGELAQAAVKIENHPFPKQFTKPVRVMLDTLGRHSTFLYRVIFANMWCFEGIFAKYCQQSGGELNAMIRTTCAITKMNAGKAYNVIPAKASVGMNLRLLGKDTLESVKTYLEEIIGNPKINVRIVEGRNPSLESDIHCAEWEKLRQVVADTWKDAIVSPYLMMAGSDSWHYCRITDRIYKFSAMKLSKEERGMIHGNNERVPVSTMVKTVEFYVRLMREI